MALTLFETVAAYNTAKDSLERPNTSYIIETNEVRYKPCSQIIYTASEQLPKTEEVDDSGEGLHVNMFNASITSHIFDDGVGIIEFDDDITEIGSYAFYGSVLTSITIPDSVTTIGDYAFYYCSDLTSITIPDSVTSIGECTFEYCSGLKAINIPDSVTTIGSEAFYQCTNLTSVTIPDSVISIGSSAFFECSGLTSVTIGNSVTGIEEDAFSSCSNLISIVVDPNNTIYDSRNNCNAVIKTSTNTLIVGCKSTIIPNSVTSIGSSAFYKCTSLTSITIPNNVTSINNWAFSGCTSLASINIPNSVTNIGDHAFSSCSGLTSITIPNGVTSIGGSAFYRCNGLTSITIPNNVISIGNSTFSNCTNLTSVTIPDSVTSIGDSAFYGCSSLTSITIPNSITSISNSAFYGCSNLACIICNRTTAPTIQSNTFYNVKTGGTLLVPAGSTGYNTWMGTGNYYLGKYGWTKVEPASTRIIYTALAKLTETTETGSSSGLHTNAFGAAMTSHTFSNGIGVIEFNGAVTSLGDSAFYGCSGLTSINIDNFTYIGDNAFQNCTRLKSIKIPSGVSRIYSSVFTGCTSLESIVVDNGNTEFDSRFGCNAIIETSTNTLLYGCKKTTIPSTVTSIGYQAFMGCTGLTSLAIGDNITSIEADAFSNCSGLKRIVCNATTAPSIANNSFYNIKTGGTLYVLSGSTGYDTWMSADDYYLGSYSWTKVEQ